MSRIISTQAIVLHHTPYSDRYCIVHLYTRQCGRLGILVPRPKRKASPGKYSLVPLSEVELLAERSPHRELATVREIKLLRANHRLQMDPIKQSQAMFVSELLYRILTHPEADHELYDYLSRSMETLDGLGRGVANFYICFAYHLLDYLAISPSIDSEDAEALRRGSLLWYDLEEVCYTPVPSNPRHALRPTEAIHLPLLERMHYGNLAAYRYSRGERGQIIDRILLYYRLHLPPFPAIKSLDILRGISPGAAVAMG